MSRLLLVGLLVVGVACGGSRAAPRTGVDYVVRDPVTTFDEIRAGAAVLSPAAARGLAPLVAARTFSRSPSLADYGLDHPMLLIAYVRAGATVTTVDIGSPNFDGHGYYARRVGDPRVFLVLRDALVPALTAAGIAPVPIADAGPGS